MDPRSTPQRIGSGHAVDQPPHFYGGSGGDPAYPQEVFRKIAAPRTCENVPGASARRCQAEHKLKTGATPTTAAGERSRRTGPDLISPAALSVDDRRPVACEGQRSQVRPLLNNNRTNRKMQSNAAAMMISFCPTTLYFNELARGRVLTNHRLERKEGARHSRSQSRLPREPLASRH